MISYRFPSSGSVSRTAEVQRSDLVIFRSPLPKTEYITPYRSLADPETQPLQRRFLLRSGWASVGELIGQAAVCVPNLNNDSVARRYPGSLYRFDPDQSRCRIGLVIGR